MGPGVLNTNDFKIYDSISEQTPLKAPLTMSLYYDNISTYNTEEYYRIVTSSSLDAFQIPHYDKNSSYIYKSHLYQLEEEEEEKGQDDRFPIIQYDITTDTDLYDVTTKSDKNTNCFGFFYENKPPKYTNLEIPDIYINNNNNTNYPCLTDYLETVYTQLTTKALSGQADPMKNILYLKKSYFKERMDNRLDKLSQDLNKISAKGNTEFNKNTILCSLIENCS